MFFSSRVEKMAIIDVFCRHCNSKEVIKNGKSRAGAQRYLCQVSNCGKTFQLAHSYKAYDRGMKERIVDMALNGSGIRDTSRVLSVAIGTVLTTLKKRPAISSKST